MQHGVHVHSVLDLLNHLCYSECVPIGLSALVLGFLPYRRLYQRLPRGMAPKLIYVCVKYFPCQRMTITELENQMVTKAN